jgi:hypothetical protein
MSIKQSFYNMLSNIYSFAYLFNARNKKTNNNKKIKQKQQQDNNNKTRIQNEFDAHQKCIHNLFNLYTTMFAKYL